MAVANSTAPKPRKPHKDYPLFAHNNGQWAKKVRGKLEYFGAWTDPHAALEEWIRVKDHLMAGRKRPPKLDEGYKLCDLVNEFLTDKLDEKKSGKITPTHFKDLKRDCGRIIEAFGRERFVEDLYPDDFKRFRRELAKGVKHQTLKNRVARIRTVFNWAFEDLKITSPVRYGTGFAYPTEAEIQEELNALGERMFEADQIHRIIAAANPAMKAMILMIANTGIGNLDLALLTFDKLDLDGGWCSMPRNKTKVKRKAKLWPETIDAINEWLDVRPEPRYAKHANRVFLTKRRLSWGDVDRSWGPISQEFRKIVKSIGLYERGNGFYSLRRTFDTIATDSNDQITVDAILGWKDKKMSTLYRQRNAEAKLIAVSDYVHDWLFGGAK